MFGSIGKTVDDAIRTSQSTVDPGLAARDAAYVQKQDEATVSLNLKRLREPIESSSFSDFSPNTQTRVKSK